MKNLSFFKRFLFVLPALPVLLIASGNWDLNVGGNIVTVSPRPLFFPGLAYLLLFDWMVKRSIKKTGEPKVKVAFILSFTVFIFLLVLAAIFSYLVVLRGAGRI